jgi:hypothetical protein
VALEKPARGSAPHPLSTLGVARAEVVRLTLIGRRPPRDLGTRGWREHSSPAKAGILGQARLGVAEYGPLGDLSASSIEHRASSGALAVCGIEAQGGRALPTFVGIVVASLLARIVYDALAPYGVVPLNLSLAAVTWLVCFAISKSFIERLRSDL